jgi:hypothetical protein
VTRVTIGDGSVDIGLEAGFIIVSMQVESLEVLEKADVAPAQARAIVRAIEIEIAGARDTLATKHDLGLLRAAFKTDISDLRAELKTDISDLRADVAKLEGRLESKIHASASSIARQMYTAVLGQMAVLLGFAYFFATYLR